MSNARPYYRPDIRWANSSRTTPPLDTRKLDTLQQIAACTAIESGVRIAVDDRQSGIDYGFAEGVAAVLAWLAGEPPTAELAVLLELEEE